jgi:hypothetical protein
MNFSYPATYSGGHSREEVASCKLLGSALKDYYNPKTKSLERQKTLSHDYFTLIRKQYKEGRVLIAMDEGWILAGIEDLLNNTGQAQTTSWLLSQTNPNGSKNISDVYIRRYNQLYMVFAKIDVESIPAITTFLYQNHRLWNEFVTFGTTSLTEAEALDIKYLYPVKLTKIHNLYIFRSDILTYDQLRSVVSEKRMVYYIDGLSPIEAAKAAIQTMEAYDFTIPVTFEDNMLSIWQCGYLQAEEIKVEFIRQLSHIPKHHIGFGFRPVFVHGDWYSERPSKTGHEPVDIFGLAISNMNSLRKILTTFGYKVNTPDGLELNLQIGYLTIDDRIEEGKGLYTIYYTMSTHGRRLDLVVSRGPKSDTFIKYISEQLNKGSLFTWSMYAICSSYPGFIPSQDVLYQPLITIPEQPLVRSERRVPITQNQ